MLFALKIKIFLFILKIQFFNFPISNWIFGNLNNWSSDRWNFNVVLFKNFLKTHTTNLKLMQKFEIQLLFYIFVKHQNKLEDQILIITSTSTIY